MARYLKVALLADGYEDEGFGSRIMVWVSCQGDTMVIISLRLCMAQLKGCVE